MVLTRASKLQQPRQPSSPVPTPRIPSSEPSVPLPNLHRPNDDEINDDDYEPPSQDSEHGSHDTQADNDDEGENGDNNDDREDADHSDASNAAQPANHQRNWLPWQDHLLVDRLLEERPFTARYRETAAAWNAFRDHLLEYSSTHGSCTPIAKSVSGIRARLKRLMDTHKVSIFNDSDNIPSLTSITRGMKVVHSRLLAQTKKSMTTWRYDTIKSAECTVSHLT